MSIRNTQKNFRLSLAVLTFSGTQIILFALFPVLSEKLHLSLSTIIASFALGTILFLVGAPYWSQKSELIGRNKVLAIGLLGLSLSFGLIAQEMISPGNFSIAFLIVSRIIYGLTASAIVPVAQLLRTEMNSTEPHLKNMLTHSFSLNMGRVLGPILIIIGQESFEVFLICLGMWSFVLSIIFFRAENPHVYKTKSNAYEPRSLLKTIALPLAVTILFTTYTGMLHSSLGGTLQKTFDLTGADATQLMAKVLLLGSIVMAVTQLMAKKLLQNRFGLGLSIGLSTLLVGAIALAFMGSFLELAVAISFICIGMALIQPSHLALVHQRFEGENIGKKIGLLSSGNTLGYAIGGLITSLLINAPIEKYALFLVLLLAVVTFKNFQEAGRA